MKYQDLSPKRVWTILKEIYGRKSKYRSLIPIPQRIKQWIVRQNEKFNLNLQISEDSIGNIFITKSATPGFKQSSSILLQAHYDLANSNFDSKQDLLTSSINLDPEGKWFEIIGTPLLDDSVVGVGIILSILTDTSGDVQHGPIEALFTVKKEGRFIGALYLDPNEIHIQSQYLLNFDAVDIGSIINGAAGCAEFTFWKKIKYLDQSTQPKLKFCHLIVSGLQGGELGSEIHFFRANALKIASRILVRIQSQNPLYLNNWTGGKSYRFIPQSTEVWFATPETNTAKLEELVREEIRHIIKKYKRFSEYGQNLEPDLKIQLTESQEFKVIDPKTSAEIISLTAWIPQGLIRKTAVENEAGKISNNFAKIQLYEDRVELSCKSRGDDQAELQAFNRTLSCIRYFGWNVINDYDFPVWEPAVPGSFLQFVKHIYQDRINHPVRVNRSYWVLEPGIIAQKFPKMQVVSIGPTEIGVFPANYKVKVNDVQILYDVTLALLTSLKEISE
ncbi:MAG: hypothetical protein DRO88_00225 [Promethearchaeia archaeon]|nr:MAG: hypothetical protein DRO88_00225 [Candidatus Lokiarchaeia archaeon]